nr:hypothetical protein HUO10_000028 [Paraburkholderia busanensis]
MLTDARPVARRGAWTWPGSTCAWQHPAAFVSRAPPTPASQLTTHRSSLTTHRAMLYPIRAIQCCRLL